MIEFNLTSLFSTLILIVGSTAGTWFFTEILKRAKSIPFIAQGNNFILRVVSGVFAGLSTNALAMSSDTLSPETLQGLVVDGLTFLSTWYGSHAIHKTLK
jgi:hypothetical protein